MVLLLRLSSRESSSWVGHYHREECRSYRTIVSDAECASPRLALAGRAQAGAVAAAADNPESPDGLAVVAGTAGSAAAAVDFLGTGSMGSRKLRKPMKNLGV